jgi:hypothetical protein
MPEVDRQAGQQRKDLIYALARTGNLDSSAAIDKAAELIQGGQQGSASASPTKGSNQANTLRNQVENTRGNVVAELNATGDASAASNSGAARVAEPQPAGGLLPARQPVPELRDSRSRASVRGRATAIRASLAAAEPAVLARLRLAARRRG